MDATPQHGTAPFSNVPIAAGDDEPAMDAAGVADAWSNIEPPAGQEDGGAGFQPPLLEARRVSDGDVIAPDSRMQSQGLHHDEPEPQAAEPDKGDDEENDVVTEPEGSAGFQPAIPEHAESLNEESEPESEERGGWTVALLGAGIAVIAACLLLPLAEENHQLAWQREKLKVDLEQIKQQVAVNAEFLHKVSDDPTLAERLAQRQMKYIRQGTSILDLHDGNDPAQQASPFQLVMLPPPNPIPPYRPLGGALCAIVRNSRARLYLIGVGLLLLACGLVLGGGAKQTYDDPA
jgi:hypothetical protein